MPSVTLSNPGTQNSYNGDSLGFVLLASDSAGNTLNFAAANLPAGMSINATSAFGPFDFVSIGGTISPTASGPYFATVTATDPITDESVTQAFTWNVSQPTVTLTPLSDQSNYDGDAVSLPVHASENDFHLLNYSASGLPTGLSINAVTGLISGTIASNADAGGPYSVTVSATDGAADVSASQTFSWAVAQPTITLTSPGDQSNYDGDTVSLGISASEDAGHTLTFSATGLPAGLSINAGTGVISGTVASDADASGPYSVTVSAADSAADVSASQTLSWAIAQPSVTLTSPGNQSNYDGDTVSLELSAADNAAHGLTYSASGLPSGLSADSSTGVVSGVISPGDDADSAYSVTLTATDSAADVSASQTLVWCISPVTVTLANPDDQANNDGYQEELQISATDSAGHDLDFTATGLPPGLHINACNAEICGTIAEDADVDSPYSVTVTAADQAAGVSASQNFLWTVDDLTPTVWGNAVPMSVPRGNLSDVIDLSEFSSGVTGDQLRYAILTQPANGQLIPLGGADFEYISNSGYTGSDSFTFGATDGALNSATSAIFDLNVTNTAPVASNTGIYYVLPGQTISIADLATYGTSASTLSFTPSIVNGPAYGQLVDLENGQYEYSAPNYPVTDSFTFTLNDGITESNVATATIDVVSSPIVANNGFAQISAQDPVIIIPSELLQNAQSEQSSPSWQVVSVGTPTYGQITANCNGTWTYMPPPNAAPQFQDNFAFTISDGTNTASANFTLAPVRNPFGLTDQQARILQRQLHMRDSTSLFPITLEQYNAMAPARQQEFNNQLAKSIEQGYSGGDSSFAATMAAAVRQYGFAWLQGRVRISGQGWEAAFNRGNAGALDWVQVDAPLDFSVYGCTADGSLWYTIYEAAYDERHRAGPLVTVGNYEQPVANRDLARLTMRVLTGLLRVPWSLQTQLQNQADLIAQLSNAAAVMTATTFTTFSAAQQTAAAEIGVVAGSAYAVVGYNAGTNTITLLDPHNTSGDGALIPISLADFRLLFAYLLSNAPPQ